MKPILFHNQKSIRESFYVQEYLQNYFYDTLHYHPEFQLSTIITGTGNAMIGDYIGRFNPGDVFLIGPNLSHVFRSDKEYYEKSNILFIHSIGIYFKENSFGESFFDLPENSGIKNLLKESEHGIRLQGENAKKISDTILEINKLSGLRRLTTLLNCLDNFARIKNEKLKLSSGLLSGIKDDDNKKMNLVFNYIMENFSGTIKLQTISEIACMTPTAFCRFFYRKTLKTFSEFLAETRIGYASQLLLQGNFSILEISYKCGYNNISNFNRQFKRIMKCTPSRYLNDVAIVSNSKV